VSSGAGAVLVPPRDNLGPEPMPGRLSTAELIGFLLIGVATALNLLWLIRRYRRIRRRDRLRAGRPAWPGVPTGPFASRGEQMAAWSAAVRAALAVRSGAPWNARTTEEIAADASLAATLGPGTVEALVRFLSEADRAKFDDREGLQPPLPDAVPGWLAELVASCDPKAGARSMIKGK
jgi:hypothetical protein